MILHIIEELRPGQCISSDFPHRYQQTNFLGGKRLHRASIRGSPADGAQDPILVSPECKGMKTAAPIFWMWRASEPMMFHFTTEISGHPGPAVQEDLLINARAGAEGQARFQAHIAPGSNEL